MSYHNYHNYGNYAPYICNGCNMAMGDLPAMYARRPQARGLGACILGKSRMTMLQVLCITLFP